MEVIRPDIHGRIPYITSSYPLPWHIDCGEVISVRINRTRIRVTVDIDRDAFMALPRYDLDTCTCPVTVMHKGIPLFETMVRIEDVDSNDTIDMVLQEV